MSTFAENLIGITIENNWMITEKISKHPDETGGNFSAQYIAVNEAGDKCFLKAIDIEKAILQSGVIGLEFTKILQEQMNNYNYERELLEYCKANSTSKIVLIKEYGVINNPHGMIPVPYLTFDLADGNVKHYIKFQEDLDFSWKLKSLHDIANGLQQLHNIEIIHQDIKPSNILQFNDDSKLTDLGRSKCKSKKGPYDDLIYSGDRTYAPIEIYKEFSFLQPTDWYDRNLAMESYLLGNLITFYFTGLNMTALIINKLGTLGISDTTTLKERKAYLDRCFNDSLEEIRTSIHYHDFADPIVTMISELCNPDPTRRNDEKTLRERGSNYSLYRYITKLDYLSNKASIKLRKNGSIN
ncbi:protein kinase [uncultured Bacteroides sp.]|uniref:protein kinase domain-containing protein n=1 Tax=uncultured Bacteroides sp. TaxID=162156 RepID=UPI00259A7306|nr:protein kinase [uncultured Bacteroides sp.]